MTSQKTIDATEALSDPHEALRHIRVIFVNPKYNFETSINGTRDDVANYYVGSRLNVGAYPTEIMKTPIRLEFIPQDASQPIVRYELPSHKCILYRGYNIIHDPPAIPIRSCDWQYAHNGYDGPEDGRCGSAASLEDAKEYIDELILDERILQNIGSDS